MEEDSLIPPTRAAKFCSIQDMCAKEAQWIGAQLNLKILLLNARSIRNKVDDIQGDSSLM